MFAGRYFAARYYAPRYWSRSLGSLIAQITAGLVGRLTLRGPRVGRVTIN